MRIEQRNFWRAWGRRSLLSTAVLAFFLAATLTPVFIVAYGAAVGSLVGVITFVLGTLAAWLAMGRHVIRKKAVMFHIFPERLRLIPPEHRYEAPSPIAVRFSEPGDALKGRLLLSLADQWHVRVFQRTVQVCGNAPSSQGVSPTCALSFEPRGDGTSIHVSPFATEVLDGGRTDDELFFDLVERLEALGGEIQRPERRLVA